MKNVVTLLMMLFAADMVVSSTLPAPFLKKAATPSRILSQSMFKSSSSAMIPWLLWNISSTHAMAAGVKSWIVLPRPIKVEPSSGITTNITRTITPITHRIVSVRLQGLAYLRPGLLSLPSFPNILMDFL